MTPEERAKLLANEVLNDLDRFIHDTTSLHAICARHICEAEDAAVEWVESELWEISPTGRCAVDIARELKRRWAGRSKG